TFEAGYVGNRGLHLTRFWNGNQALTPGTSATLQSRRPYPNYADIEYMDSGGSSFYNALQTRLEKRYSKGVSLLHSFTYGRGTDNIGAWNDPNASITPQNAYDFRSEKALSANVVKLSSVTSFIYQLPFGRGRRYMNSSPAFAQTVFGGWEMAGIWNWRGGIPVTISSATCGSCQIGGQRTHRAAVGPGVRTSVADH